MNTGNSLVGNHVLVERQTASKDSQGVSSTYTVVHLSNVFFHMVLPHTTTTTVFIEHSHSEIRGSRGGVVVRALTSHQCGPGSILGPVVICGLSLLLALSSL